MSAKHQRDYKRRNPERVRESNRLYRPRHPEESRVRAREGHLRRKFGMTIAGHAAMLEKQGNVCAICARPKAGLWATDHDHDTGRVRGVVHVFCNALLGFVESRPELLRQIAEYLERTSR